MTTYSLRRPSISQRSYKRRGLVAYGLIVALIILSLLGNWLSPKVFLPIESVKIVGTLNQLPQEQLEAAVSNLTGYGFFSVDVQQIKSLIEALSWVQSVSVRRVWPSSLELVIDEHRAIAVWNDGALINEQGVLFTPQAGLVSEPVPELRGPSGKHLEAYEQYRMMQSVLGQVNLKIASVTIDERLAIEMQLDDGIRLLLGRKLDSLDVEAELERLVYACQNGLAERLHRVELVDLRYTNGFSIKWKA